jgi:hypothetical protein
MQHLQYFQNFRDHILLNKIRLDIFRQFCPPRVPLHDRSFEQFGALAWGGISFAFFSFAFFCSEVRVIYVNQAALNLPLPLVHT